MSGKLNLQQATQNMETYSQEMVPLHSHSGQVLLSAHNLEGWEMCFSIILMALAQFYGMLQGAQPRAWE